MFVLPPHVADLDRLGVPGPGLDCAQLRGLPRRVEGGVAHAGQHRDLRRGQVVQVQGPHLTTHILHSSLMHITFTITEEAQFHVYFYRELRPV